MGSRKKPDIQIVFVGLASTRRVSADDFEVLRPDDGEVIGRVQRAPASRPPFTARWWVRDAAGTRIASDCTSRTEAVARLLDRTSA